MHDAVGLNFGGYASFHAAVTWWVGIRNDLVVAVGNVISFILNWKGVETPETPAQTGCSPIDLYLRKLPWNGTDQGFQFNSNKAVLSLFTGVISRCQ